MNKTVSEIVFVFLAAYLISFLLIPLLNKIALKQGYIISWRKRKKRVSSKPAIAISGLAIPVAFIAALMFSFFIADKSFRQLFGSVKLFLGFIIGGLVIFIVGILHDIRPVPRKVRFLFYILASLCAVTSGITIFKLSIPFTKGGQIAVYSVIGYVITVLWILLFMFVIRFLNDMEQYQSGIIAASFFVTLIMGFMVKNYAVQFISVSMLGAYMGFLPYNFNKNMNIMGETGSVFTGYTLAVLSIIGSIKSAVGVGVVIPLIFIAFPVFELLVYLIKKIFKFKNNPAPVMGPLYYRLKQNNYEENQVLLIII